MRENPRKLSPGNRIILPGCTISRFKNPTPGPIRHTPHRRNNEVNVITVLLPKKSRRVIIRKSLCVRELPARSLRVIDCLQ